MIGLNSNIDVIVGDTIRVLSCTSARILTFRFPCNLFLILRIKDGFCDRVGGVILLTVIGTFELSNGMLRDPDMQGSSAGC